MRTQGWPSRATCACWSRRMQFNAPSIRSHPRGRSFPAPQEAARHLLKRPGRACQPHACRASTVPSLRRLRRRLAPAQTAPVCLRCQVPDKPRLCAPVVGPPASPPSDAAAVVAAPRHGPTYSMQRSNFLFDHSNLTARRPNLIGRRPRPTSQARVTW